MRRFIKWIRRLLAALLVIGICAGGAVGFLGWRMYRDALEQKPLEAALAEIRAKPGYTGLEELPRIYLDAVVAVEDHRFYRHGGVDPIAIGRALWNNLRAWDLVEGGSTITQQLAKNLFFSQARSVVRKAAELFMAFRLEGACTKEEILALYLNSIYFGDGYDCVSDASRGYFGKAPADMTDGESTLLAGVPNAPSAYAPTASPELAKSRQRQVLRQMVKHNYLTQSQADAILAEG